MRVYFTSEDFTADKPSLWNGRFITFYFNEFPESLSWEKYSNASNVKLAKHFAQKFLG